MVRKSGSSNLVSQQAMPGKSSGKVTEPLLPAKSHAKAADAFKDFSLSKFGGAKSPANFVGAGESPHATHREMMSRQIADVPDDVISKRSMTFALPPATLRTLAPSFDPQKKTADLSDVLKLVTKYLRGTEFVTTGNPVLRRFALQAQVDQIMSAIKAGGKK